MIRPTALPSRGYRSMTGGAGHKCAISNSPSTSKLQARNVYRMMAVAAPPAGGFVPARRPENGSHDLRLAPDGIGAGGSIGTIGT